MQNPRRRSLLRRRRGC